MKTVDEHQRWIKQFIDDNPITPRVYTPLNELHPPKSNVFMQWLYNWATNPDGWDECDS